MQYNIFLKRKDGTFKVSAFDCRATEAAAQFSLYLFRHYPVSFFDDPLNESGDTEKILKDTRSGLIIWRQGDMECKLPEGFFYVDQIKPNQEQEWWELSLPKSKKMVIETAVENAYNNGFKAGYNKGVEDGKEEGYRQGLLDVCASFN